MTARRGVLRTSLLAFALAAFSACGNSSQTRTLDVAVLAASGPHTVTVRDVDLVDTTRSTPPNGSFPGSTSRSLPTRVWLPATTDGNEKFPVVAYAHGFGADSSEGATFAEHLASHGYVVAAPTFPLSSGSAPGGSTAEDLGQQPADLMFVLDQLAAATGPAPDVAAATDAAHRALFGLSAGGETILLAGFGTPYLVSGIDALVTLAPSSCIFGAGFYGRSVPLLVMGGDSDLISPFAADAALTFQDAPAPATLVRLLGGTHLGFVGREDPGTGNVDLVCRDSSGPTPGIGAFVSEILRTLGPSELDPAACAVPGCDPSLRQGMTGARQVELTKAATLAFLDARLKGDEAAARFLEGGLAGEASDVALSVK